MIKIPNTIKRTELVYREPVSRLEDFSEIVIGTVTGARLDQLNKLVLLYIPKNEGVRHSIPYRIEGMPEIGGKFDGGRAAKHDVYKSSARVTFYHNNQVVGSLDFAANN